MNTYKLVWDDFCAWYLEMVKPPFGGAMDRATYEASVAILENILKVLHPFMPFLTEEIWQYLRPREEGKGSICISTWPSSGPIDEQLTRQFDAFSEVVIGIRNIRKDKNIPNKEKVKLLVKATTTNDTSFDAVVMHLCNIESIEYVHDKPTSCYSFVMTGAEYFVPFTANVDVEAERIKIQQEITYLQGFLKSVDTKLNNERFVSKAPADVLEIERKKQRDTMAKITMLEEQLGSL